MKKLILSLIVTLLFSACGSIRTHRSLYQPLGKVLIACPGGEILRVSKKRDLPNAFGRADIWGGKVDAGYDVVIYMGILKNGNFLFRLFTVDTFSNENTVNRYGAGLIIRGPLGPQIIGSGYTYRIPGMTKDIVVDFLSRRFWYFNEWIVSFGTPDKRSGCIKYRID